MATTKVSHQQATKNPLIVVREKLGMTRFDLAALAYVGDAFVGNVEAGRFANIPTSLIETLAPYLGGIGETQEGLQSAYKAWRAGLAADVRRRADRYCELLRIHPGLEGVDPNDTTLIESFLTEK